MIVGLSLGHRDVAAADDWISTLLPAPAEAETHLVREPYPHVAISLKLDQPVPLPVVPAELRPAAEAAAAAHGRSGRAVVYPGSDRLRGVMTVADVLSDAAIDDVVVVGGGAVGPESALDTRDFVRPHWISGRLTLQVVPAAGGRHAPFERQHEPSCCDGHSG